MTDIADLKSGKSERDENFPVASALIAPRFRQPILGFYRFARAADDVADHPHLPEREKLAALDLLEATLLGRTDAAHDALPLRRALADTGLAPDHALDLLTAFRLDVTKRRYRDWAELMRYCGYSAMPVGRFVLDVHGEARSTWPASDALCAALQVINHLQDCAKDYRALDRVYLPLDALGAHGIGVEELAKTKASPPLRRCLESLAVKTGELVADATKLPYQVTSVRLAAETAVIVGLARRLIRLLPTRDPLSERVHLSKVGTLGVAARTVSRVLVGRTLPWIWPIAATRGDAW
ncbi:MAG TPA: squalene synthase HpnC [Hyphomicrobiaceae bacterium]|jgi:squalene synthase HpnC